MSCQHSWETKSYFDQNGKRITDTVCSHCGETRVQINPLIAVFSVSLFIVLGYIAWRCL